MLKEIQSNVFRTNGKNGPIRPKIELNKGLNVVNGSVSGTNSIGKSTFLMVIDFCLGGKDYYEKLKPVKDNIGNHEINFAFEFKNEMFYFCRNTGNPDIIHICDALDAATDTYGRIYKESKTYVEIREELLRGRCSEYNPEVVDIILGNERLSKTLEFIIQQGREVFLYLVSATLDQMAAP